MLKRVDYYLGIACTQNEWKHLFGRHYPVLRCFLYGTDEQASLWCSPSHGYKLEVILEGEGYTAISPDYVAQPELEVTKIPSDELRLWEFCQITLARHFCYAFGLQADPKPMGKGILRLGTLSHRTGRRPAYLLTSVERNYLPLAKSTVADHSGKCLFYTPRYCPDTSDWLRQRQHGYFPLEDLLDTQTLEPAPAYRQVFLRFIYSLPSAVYRPDPAVRIMPDYKRIVFPDGYEINLSRAYKRRAIVRFIFDWIHQSGSDVFDVETVREDYNKQHPEHPWDSDRFREDLFKRNAEDFDRLFETLDAPNGQFRLKI